MIADFQSRGESPEAVRKKAADIGADAVIISILGGYYSRSEEWAGATDTPPPITALLERPSGTNDYEGGKVRAKVIFFALLCGLLVGCAEVDVTKTAKGFRDQTNPNEVEILKTRPDKPYEELGKVTATGFSPDESALMHNSIRAKSAALGATAVILTEEGIIRGGWGTRRWATGVAIRYK